MKPLYRSLFALSILFSTQSFAQNYIPFPDSNAMWTNTLTTYEWTGGQFPTPTLENVDYFCMGTEDTIINTINYNKLDLCGIEYYGALRDNGGEVFFIPKDSTDELLIYDFSKSVGDTIFDVYYQEYMLDDWVSDDFVVESIDSMLIGANYHNFLYLQGMGSMWIEGIGNSYGLFKESYPNASNYQWLMNCMSTSNEVLYPTYGIGACPLNVNVDEIDFSSQITLSPNPTNDVLTISSKEKPFSFELYDVTGKVLMTSEEQSTFSSIDLRGQNAGVYTVLVKVGDRFKSFRVVRE